MTTSNGVSEQLSNLERLLAHLDKDSLAAKLVAAFASSAPASRVEALREIARSRLEALKQEIDDASD